MKEVASIYYVLAYYNRLVGEFMSGFMVDMPPEVFANTLRRQLKLHKEEGYKQHLDECRLFHVGSFDATNGLLIPLEKPEELLDCMEVLPHVED